MDLTRQPMKTQKREDHYCHNQFQEMFPYERMRATLYGQCIGDAIGILTEFMTEEDVRKYYRIGRPLEYNMKIKDKHRSRWESGDWTDDSDQMILIMDCLTEDNGLVDPVKFASKIKNWIHNGFPELGDNGGCGIGCLTYDVTSHPLFKTQPFKAARDIWERTGCNIAPNGGVMRTSILGLHEFWDVDKVKKNAVDICKVTHFDKRCQASVVAVSVAISLMVNGRHMHKQQYNIKEIISEACDHALEYLDNKKQKDELVFAMRCENLSSLNISCDRSIGYTFTALGAGFWALKQNNFREAIEMIVRKGGDADSNAAVAGALLGCKLGIDAIPQTWLCKLIHKPWLDKKMSKYFEVLGNMWIKKQKIQNTGALRF